MGRLTALLAAAVIMALPAVAGAQTPEPVPFASIERDDGGSSGYDARTTFVIRTERRWRHVWRRLHGRVMPLPRRPRVSFRRSTVIAVLRRAGTGIGLEVESVARDAAGLHVRVNETRAADGCAVPQQIVKPYEVIRVPRTAKPVRTARRELVSDPCF